MLEHLYDALSSPFGRILHCGPGELTAVRQKLYETRRQAADPDLDVLTFLQSPTNPDDIWIVRKSRKPDAPAA